MAAGNLDPTFGTGGKLIATSPTTGIGSFIPTESFVQSNGKTVVAGLATIGTAFGAKAVSSLNRYNVDGSLDTTFGVNGNVNATSLPSVFSPSGLSVYKGVNQQSDGKIIVYGNNPDAVDPIGVPRLQISRYTSDGVIDSTYGSNGIATTNIPSSSATVSEYNGKVLISQTGTVLGSQEVSRYDSNGVLDRTFGNNGSITIPAISGINATAEQSDGKILVNGIPSGGVVGNVLRRYNSDGSPDATFGTGGTVFYPFTVLRPNIALQSDGKIFLSNPDSITRYNVNGTLDNTFGTNGSIKPATQTFTKPILESDGKILVGANNVDDFVITRYNVSGTLDTTFGTNGIVTTDFNNQPDRLFSIGQQSDGKIVAAGIIVNADGKTVSFGAARYTNDGGTPPVGTAPVGTAPISTAPIGTAPVGTAPVGTAPIGTAPIGTALVTPTSLVAIPGISLTNNFLSTDSTSKGFSVKAVSQTNNKVNQIAVVAVDNVTGTVNGLAPTAPGYLAAVLTKAQPILTTLASPFFNTKAQEFALDPNKSYEFIEIQNGSIEEAKQQLAEGVTPANVLLSTSDASSPIKVTTNSTKDGYQVSTNDGLVLNVTKLGGTTVDQPIGSNLQNSAEGRLLDLTAFGASQTLKLDITTKSSAAYQDSFGFYAVENAAGDLKLANGSTISVGDPKYAVEAVKQALANALIASQTDSKTSNIAGGKIYAPVVVAKGTLTDFVKANTNTGDANSIHAYFNYLGANPDKVDHFRLLGSNSFGVEDLYGGGDRDFNDVVVNFTAKV